uniref:Uncharacterized protein n=1 Tax=Rhizophora mucronata TaxID=61149 RepID=A0A2P2PZ94_RHIMU
MIVQTESSAWEEESKCGPAEAGRPQRVLESSALCRASQSGRPGASETPSSAPTR